jgi:hypothetical protein
MFSLFQVKVYLIFSFIEISHTVRNTDNCLEPDNLIELARKLARDNLNFHNSYYMLAPLRSAWGKKDREYHPALSRYKTPFNMKIHGRRECPKYLQTSVKEMVSTCTVIWELNHDIARVLRTIVQAQCMCKTCLIRTGHFFSWILYWYSTRASNFDFLYHSSIYINIIIITVYSS